MRLRLHILGNIELNLRLGHGLKNLKTTNQIELNKKDRFYISEIFSFIFILLYVKLKLNESCISKMNHIKIIVFVTISVHLMLLCLQAIAESKCC